MNQSSNVPIYEENVSASFMILNTRFGHNVCEWNTDSTTSEKEFFAEFVTDTTFLTYSSDFNWRIRSVNECMDTARFEFPSNRTGLYSKICSFDNNKFLVIIGRQIQLVDLSENRVRTVQLSDYYPLPKSLIDSDSTSYTFVSDRFTNNQKMQVRLLK